jgi:hypothetical protein
MRTIFIIGICTCMLLGFSSGPVLGQQMVGDLFVYPSEGQSQDQQSRDAWECQNWARETTGFDPLARAQVSTPPPAAGAPRGGALRGGALGAAGGLAVGALTGNTRRGAAIGAGSGALMGGLVRNDQNRQQAQAEEQWARREMNQYQRDRDAFNRAMTVCLEGRGYAVR